MENCNFARFAAVALGVAILIVSQAFAQTQPPTQGPAESGRMTKMVASAK